MNSILRYPLEGDALDVPLAEVLSATPDERQQYVQDLLTGFENEIQTGAMALRRKVPTDQQIRDASKINNLATDQYLFTDDRTLKRNVLGKGSPGYTHTDWSRHNMWKMRTKIGDASVEILTRSQKLVKALGKLFDPNDSSKRSFRKPRKSAVGNALDYIRTQLGSGCAFPPFHARYFADKYLPLDGSCVVVDPCAGWGGRMLGCLLAPRSNKIAFYGIDPEERNRSAYEGLANVAKVELKDEIWGPRETHFDYLPFEDWLGTPTAQALMGNVDLAITSPPYWKAENYNPDNPNQSANRYPTYQGWHDGFLRPLIEGAFNLLKPGAHFVLNISNVDEAPRLEDHACKIAKAVGFQRTDSYQLALSLGPGHRTPGRKIRTVTVDGAIFKSEPVFCFRRPHLVVASNGGGMYY